MKKKRLCSDLNKIFIRHVALACLLTLSLHSYAQNFNTLTKEEKIFGLSKFWEEAKWNFAYFDQVPEINWDSTYVNYISKVLITNSDIEYFMVLKSFAALLKDGHSTVSLPWYIRKDSLGHPGIELKSFQGKIIVVNIISDLEDSIPIGSEVIKVDGNNVTSYLENEIMPYISSSTSHSLINKSVENMLLGWYNSTVRIKIRTPDGHDRKVLLSRKKHKNLEWVRQKPPIRNFEFKKFDNDISYIALNTFSEESIIVSFTNTLPDLLKSKGVIVDLRKNDGGDSRIGAEILSYFTEQEFILGSSWRTRKHNAAFKAWGRYAKEDIELSEYAPYFNNNAWYSEGPDTIFTESEIKKIIVPMVIIIGNGTFSAAEDFLVYLDNIKDRSYTIIGEKTGGSTGEPLMFELPGGAWGYVCTKRDTYPDGRDFVGYGISPDIEVIPSIQDYLNSNDIVLLRATEMLVKMINQE